MNRERAKELLPIIQAFAEGKEIQFRLDEIIKSTWSDLHEETAFTFPADDYEYRIKPKPREFWIEIGCNGKHVRGAGWYEEGDKLPEKHGSVEIIKVREVIE